MELLNEDDHTSTLEADRILGELSFLKGKVQSLDLYNPADPVTNNDFVFNLIQQHPTLTKLRILCSKVGVVVNRNNWIGIQEKRGYKER
jgi:hypothetical protein